MGYTFRVILYSNYVIIRFTITSGSYSALKGPRLVVLKPPCKDYSNLLEISLHRYQSNRCCGVMQERISSWREKERKR